MAHRAGQHVDEGTLHAWLDGALPADDAAAVEAHVAGCEACAAAVAEARGLVAAASRILTALDEVPAGVLPLGGAGAGAGAERRRGEYSRRRRPVIGWPLRAAAAILVVAAGSLVVIQRGGGVSRAPAAETVRPAAPAPVLSSAPAPTPAPARADTSTAAPVVDGVAKERRTLDQVHAAPGLAAALPTAASSMDAARKSAPEAQGVHDASSRAPRAAPATDSAAFADSPRPARRDARSGSRVTVLRGRVISSANGQPVPSATVSLLEPARAVQTGTAGEYAIAVPDTLARATVHVRALGYAPVTDTVTLSRDSASHDIALNVSTAQIGPLPLFRDSTPGPSGCYLTTSVFFPSSFSLDTVPVAATRVDTLLLRVGAADARRFPIAYWTRLGPDSVTLFVAADTEEPGLRIDAALSPTGLDGHTVPPDDAVSQSSPFTATRCRPTR